MTWLVRPAGEGDIDAVVALEARAFGPASWGAESVRAGFHAARVEALVAVAAEGPEADAVKGYALWRALGDEAEILSLAAAPEARRAGMARALLEAIVSAAQTAGAGTIFLEVNAQNEAALGLYRTAGFEAAGERRRYYRDGGDALVLRRAI